MELFAFDKIWLTESQNKLPWLSNAADVAELLRFANTEAGREFFGVPAGKTIFKLTTGSVHYFTGDFSKDGMPKACAIGYPGHGVLEKVKVLVAYPDFVEMSLMGMKYHSPLLVALDTGAKAPSSTGFDASGFGAGDLNRWNNPTNAYSNNGSYATHSDGAAQRYQSYGGFAFGIGATDTIDGIVAVAEANRSAGNVGLIIGIHEGGGVWRTKTNTVTSGTDTVYTYGTGTTDLWGGTWTGSDFSDANAAVYISADAYGGTLSVDYITVQIYYTLGSTAWTKEISETYNVTDSISRQIVKNATETYAIVDSVLKSISRTIADTFAIVEEVITMRTQYLVLTETYAIVDSISRSIGKVVSETFSAVDSISKSIGKTISDTFSITDTIASVVHRIGLKPILKLMGINIKATAENKSKPSGNSSNGSKPNLKS